jgi:hypothetical protein
LPPAAAAARVIRRATLEQDPGNDRPGRDWWIFMVARAAPPARPAPQPVMPG